MKQTLIATLSITILLWSSSLKAQDRAWEQRLTAAQLSFDEKVYADSEALLSPALKQSETSEWSDERLSGLLKLTSKVYVALHRVKAVEPILRRLIDVATAR